MNQSATKRLLPFYLLSYKLASKLKSIFSMYLIYFVENVEFDVVGGLFDWISCLHSVRFLNSFNDSYNKDVSFFLV